MFKLDQSMTLQKYSCSILVLSTPTVGDISFVSSAKQKPWLFFKELGEVVYIEQERYYR